MPNEMPLLSAKLNADPKFAVVPADMRILVMPAAVPAAAPMMEIVAEPAFELPESVMLSCPTKTTRPVNTPVSPAVLPRLLSPTASPPAPAAAPIMEIVSDPALDEPESVMLLEPTSTIRPVTTPVWPSVLPRLLSPTDSCAGTVGTV